MKASSKRHDSPVRHIDVTVQGKRVRVSTGLTDKAKADAVAIAAQNLADNIKDASQERLKRLCGAIFDAAGVVPFWEGERHLDVRFAPWSDQWMESHLDMNEELRVKYTSVLVGFLAYRSNLPVRDIKPSDVAGWAKCLGQKNSPATVKQKVGLLATALQDAVDDGILASNPAKKVKLEGGATVERDALTDEQINQLRSWLWRGSEPHKDEWIVAIDLARWQGLRLMDAVNIGPESVKDDVLDFVCRKTGERLVVPLHPAVDSIILAKGFCKKLRLKSKSQLSQTFTRFLERAGIENPVTVSASGKRLRKLGFHSLRHSFVTALERAGVPEETRMKLAGHKSKRVHAGYSHVDPVQEARKISVTW